jgi:hypothetical protein
MTALFQKLTIPEHGLVLGGQASFRVRGSGARDKAAGRHLS